MNEDIFEGTHFSSQYLQVVSLPNHFFLGIGQLVLNWRGKYFYELDWLWDTVEESEIRVGLIKLVVILWDEHLKTKVFLLFSDVVPAEEGGKSAHAEVVFLFANAEGLVAGAGVFGQERTVKLTYVYDAVSPLALPA